MFTVKYVDHNGHETLGEYPYVVADRTDNGLQRILVFNDLPSASLDNNCGMFVEQRDAPFAPRLFVMNSHGATVSAYRL